MTVDIHSKPTRQTECTPCQGLGSIEVTGARCVVCGGSGWVPVQTASTGENTEMRPGSVTNKDSKTTPPQVKRRFVRAVEAAFACSGTAADYRRALRIAKRMKAKEQLLVLDALFEASQRIGVVPQSGAPLPVSPGSRLSRITVIGGRPVTVEVL